MELLELMFLCSFCIRAAVMTPSDSIRLQLPEPYGGDGADLIVLANGSTAGAASLVVVVQILSISTADGASLMKVAGQDSITTEAATALTITGGNGLDTITFTNAAVTAGMSVDGGDQADAIYVGTAASALTNFFGAGSVAGGNGADTIVAAGMASAGSISGGAGADSIMLTQFSGGLNSTFDATINGGAGTDTITFKTTANGLQLSLLSALASGVASVVYEAGDVITIAATAYTALAGAAANGLINIGSSAGSFTRSGSNFGVNLLQRQN